MPGEERRWSLSDHVSDRMTRRRERIREEIQRNRRGEYLVPTWVLVAALVAIIAGWIALVVVA